MDIRFVYFDLDDTLLDHRHAEQRALADLHRAFERHFAPHSIEHLQQTYHRFNVALWERYGRGEIDRVELQRLRFEQILEELVLEGLTPPRLNEIYLQRYAEHWQYTTGAREAFLDIAATYPVGVLTNGFSEVQHAKLARFPEIRSRLHALVISDEAGYMKPDRRLFEIAAGAAGHSPEHILYVGDSYRSDAQGALEAGWWCAWYTGEAGSAHDPERLFRFGYWPELTAFLSNGPAT